MYSISNRSCLIIIILNICSIYWLSTMLTKLYQRSFNIKIRSSLLSISNSSYILPHICSYCMWFCISMLQTSITRSSKMHMNLSIWINKEVECISFYISVPKTKDSLSFASGYYSYIHIQSETWFKYFSSFNL